MSAAKIARLADRGVVSVTGADSEKLLQGLVTNDLQGLAEGEARHAALLAPQGKILFDFFVVRHGDGYLLDVARAKAAELAKRMAMYKLRADVTITDVSDSFKVFALWGADSKMLAEGRGISFPDPRHRGIGLRLLASPHENFLSSDGAESEGDSRLAYDALRIEYGIPEGGKDYEFGDAYPHEADFDLLNGVSFTKGCFIGQEVVARMQNKTLVRKRAVKISANAPLEPNSEILLGDISVGRVGTADGTNAIAMLRLDRVIEGEQKSLPLTAGGIAIAPDEDAMNRYRSAAAARASQSTRPIS
ncbi:folate-binding protein [Hyphomicrobium sp. B1]|uniref:CAF17-like 4Fe-4S cluster assembly/insertion protein YgfZ n=1 Tax=unclassified Hyphomicrobium TaxID=2619925 RepID=UPI003919559E